MTKKSKSSLDEEEQKLLASFTKGAWKRVKNLQKDLAISKRAASNRLQKTA